MVKKWHYVAITGIMAHLHIGLVWATKNASWGKKIVMKNMQTHIFMKANKQHSIGGYQPICEYDGPPLVPPPKNPKSTTTRSRIRANVGDHVLATKYVDGHAGDPWVVGVITDIFQDDKGTRCLCWTLDMPDSVRTYRRAIRIKSNDEAEHLIFIGTWLEKNNPLKSMYSVLGEYRKKKKPFLTYDPKAIDD